MLTRRVMPETVARALVENATAFRFTPAQLDVLRPAASRSRYPAGCGCASCTAAAQAETTAYLAGPAYTSMPEDFERPADCAPQIAHAARMFGIGPGRDLPDPADPGAVAGWIDHLGGPLGWSHDLDWKSGRLDRDGRELLAARLGDLADTALATKRQYNRHVRVLRDLEDKRRRMAKAGELRRLVLIGRSGFAVDIGPGRFAADMHAAAFITYLTARKYRRRQFTLEGRENPVDAAAQMLLDRCERRAGTDWDMIAGVHPRPAILARLGDDQAGNLLGRWWSVMSATAEILAGLWPGEGDWREGKVNPAEMVTAKGIDSSTWNTVAQAYNAARAGWLAACAARGAGDLTGPFLPGKVMRVMAYDLQRWHSAASGSAAHPDTAVWAGLPARGTSSTGWRSAPPPTSSARATGPASTRPGRGGPRRLPTGLRQRSPRHRSWSTASRSRRRCGRGCCATPGCSPARPPPRPRRRSTRRCSARPPSTPAR